MTPSRTLLLCWLLLLALLGTSAMAAVYLPAVVAPTVSLLCAVLMAALVIAVFMNLRQADALQRLLALGGLLWLGFLLGITLLAFASG